MHMIPDRDDLGLAFQDPSKGHFVEMPAMANMGLLHPWHSLRKVETEISLVLPGSLCLQVLVEGLLSACFVGLNFPVFGLEALGATFECQGFLNKVLLAVLLGDAVAEELGRALNDGSNLRIFWRFSLAILFLVVTLGIKHRTHADELQISLKLWCHFCLRKVEPLRSSSRLVLSKVRIVSNCPQI